MAVGLLTPRQQQQNTHIHTHDSKQISGMANKSQRGDVTTTATMIANRARTNMMKSIPIIGTKVSAHNGTLSKRKERTVSELTPR